MGLDIRIPLGMLFFILGMLMVGYGALTHGSDLYLISEGVNLNLIWGAVMALFGAGMWIAGRRGATRKP